MGIDDRTKVDEGILHAFYVNRTNEPLLAASGISRRQAGGDRWLLRDVSFDLRGGDRLAIVGPTGSGKTLLLRALSLLDPVDQGQVLWHGAPVRGGAVPEFRGRAIYLRQRPALVEGSVEENLRQPFALRVHRGKRFDRGRIVDYLSAVSRDDSFLARSQRDLSGGEVQIVALLRAIQLEPEVLLLDEPTSALDAAATQAMETLIEYWMSQPGRVRALVWVSHDLQQALRVSQQRLLRIRDGRIVTEPI